MALRVSDRVLETSTSTGTGAFTLAGATVGYRAFSSVCSVADTCYYLIEGVDANGNASGEWEAGLGTYSATNTLTRTTPQASSNSGSAVTFSAGTKRVMIDATATYLASLASTGGLLAANNLSDVSSAATSRTNLGATTVGANLFTLANPSAITFPRYNADNSVSALSASALRTAIGLVIGTDVPARSPSIQAVTSSATVTPTFADDQVNITAQAAGLTLANPTGTTVDGWGIAVRIKDNGTARSISFGTQYRALGVTLPTTTVVSKTLYLGMVFNNADTKWDVVAVAQEA